MKELSHNDWINSLRVLALFAVIIIHVSAPAVTSQYFTDNSSWWIANFYNSLCRPCVPIFVMITGSLLLPKKDGTKEFLSKRIKKIIYPFIFWSQIYLLYQLALRIMQGEYPNVISLLLLEIRQIVTGTSVHLWYVYMLLGLYLTIPIIKPWIQNASNKEIGYFLVIWVFTLAINVIRPSGPIDLQLLYFSGYIGYLVLGYYLAHRFTASKIILRLSALFFVIGFLVTFFGTFYINKHNLLTEYDFYDFLSINVALCASTVFLLFKEKYISFKGAILSTIVKKINAYSFGIYLSHMLLLAFLFQIRIDYRIFGPATGIPFTAIICLILSLIIVKIINVLPYGKYISGN